MENHPCTSPIIQKTTLRLTHILVQVHTQKLTHPFTSPSPHPPLYESESIPKLTLTRLQKTSKLSLTLVLKHSQTHSYTDTSPKQPKTHLCSNPKSTPNSPWHLIKHSTKPAFCQCLPAWNQMRNCHMFLACVCLFGRCDQEIALGIIRLY